jgi:hypothetical protein
VQFQTFRAPTISHMDQTDSMSAFAASRTAATAPLESTS